MKTIAYESLKKEFFSGQVLNLDRSFELARICSRLLGSDDTENQGRDLAIRALDNKQLLHEATVPLWNDLLESAGLYPYVERKSLSLSGFVRAEYHQSIYLPDLYLHREQMRLSAEIDAGKSLIVSAPTSFGKSLLIQEIVASRKYKNIVIVQPTLALIDETRKKLSKYSDSYSLIVSTSQKPSATGNIYIFTGERVVEYQEFSRVDFFVIDEFYKLSLDRGDDRAVILNQALYKLLRMTSRFYLLGPNIKEITPQFNAHFPAVWHRSDFSTVSVDVHKTYEGRGWKANDPERTFELCRLLLTISGQTIIYCAGPEKATNLAREFLKFKKKVGKRKVSHSHSALSAELIEWIGENVHEEWCLADAIENGIAFHHGNLPRHLGSSIVDLFNEGEVKFLFCTSTLIEGVNTEARNVVLFDKKKGLKPIDYFDYKNIVGRSGRMNIHYVGQVFEFHPDPRQLELYVDIPLFEQKNAPLELLVQLDRADVQPNVKEKLASFYQLNTDLQRVIKGNAGVSVDGQIELVNELRRDVSYYHRQLNWKGHPTFEEMLAAVDLCWRYLVKSTDSRHNVRSAKQLAYMAIVYLSSRSIKGLISSQVKSDYWRGQIEGEYERVQYLTLFYLGVVRHWFEFKLPKLLSCLSSLQEYVFASAGLKAGNYAYCAAQLENSFSKGNLSVFMDYDVPASAIRKLERRFSGEESWADLCRRLRSLDFEALGLLPYEARKIRKAIQGLS